MRRPRSDRRLFELCRQNLHLAVGHLIELIFDALESLEPLKPHPPSLFLSAEQQPL